ncbi:blue light sensor protein [Mucilaginibacter hurinus]|uniref:Blue light sensor protein n=1 Tax=Mucilaginibacter hurinus TaxID=2201324 RepID=A0A367GM30_9SPHI|nr:BLUF domain-containing protein [Mucilaginibacter hurinus]RCH54095.1 blue light sensor protein [Mucilaginibacter hurinus]
MYNLIYISTATNLFTEYELMDLLDASRANNLKHNVTGMLLYAEGTFIQVLEGDLEQVNKVLAKIANDRRHKNIIELASGPVEKRNFPDWSMGFASVNADILKEFEGYVNPVDKDFIKTNNTNAAVVMLKSFAENNKLN